MTSDKQLLEQALGALDSLMYWDNSKPEYDEARKTIAAIQARLEQPAPTVQEPVGTVKDLFKHSAWERVDVAGSTKVYLDVPPNVATPLAAPVQEPPLIAELLCVCGAEWEWRNRDWELVSTPAAQPVQEEIQRLTALVRAQQITIEKLEAQLKEKNSD